MDLLPCMRYSSASTEGRTTCNRSAVVLEITALKSCVTHASTELRRRHNCPRIKTLGIPSNVGHAATDGLRIAYSRHVANVAVEREKWLDHRLLKDRCSMSSREINATPTDWNAHRAGSSLDASSLSPNSDFYMTSADAAQIMNPDCFSPEIAQFILDEKLFLRNVLLKEQYECIIEVGCHTGQNADWLSDLCSRYVGVDINSHVIERAIQTRRVPGKIEFFCAPVENLLSVLLPEESYPRRKVVLFPFNLFGNFIDVRRLLRVLDMKGLDVALSNFNTKSATTIGRYNYYVRCFGELAIRVYDAEQGVLFKAGKRFQSIAFNPAYLAGVVQEISDYHGTLMPFSVYGYLLLLTK